MVASRTTLHYGSGSGLLASIVLRQLFDSTYGLCFPFPPVLILRSCRPPVLPRHPTFSVRERDLVAQAKDDKNSKQVPDSTHGPLDERFAKLVKKLWSDGTFQATPLRSSKTWVKGED